MKMRFALILSAAILIPLLIGCVQPRLIQDNGSGGVVAVPSSSYEAEGMQWVRENYCPGAYKVSAQEVVVGERTTTSSRERESRSGRTTYGSSSSTTRAQTEWHITFACE